MSEKNPRPDWRQHGKKNTGPAQAAGAGKRDWQKQIHQVAGPRKPWSKGSKLGFAVVLLSFAIGGVYVFIEYLKPISPTKLVLIGASGDENLALPHNVYGWQNIVDLGQISKDGSFSESGRPSLVGPVELKKLDSWDIEWDKISSSFKEKTIVVNVALHGAANSKEAYFFIPDEKDYSRLPLEKVLKALASPNLSEKKIVLILEPAQFSAHWPTGTLQNDFVRKLKALEDKIKAQTNLIVMCASDVDQTSWFSEEWQQTIFGHYVLEGMKGAADAKSEGGDGNGRITVAELFDYVKRRVQAWAQHNRVAEQTPVLLGGAERAEEFAVAQISKDYKEASPDSAPGREFNPPESLKTAWTEWHKLGQLVPHPAAYSPQIWRRYQDTLLRYEQLLRAGDVTKKAPDLFGRLVTMNQEIRNKAKFQTAEECLSQSMPMAEVLGMAPLHQEDLEKRLRSFWDANKDEKRPDLLQDITALKDKTDAANPHVFRVQVYRSFLKLVASSPDGLKDLLGKDGDKDETKSKGQAILDLLESKLSKPRPAEVHFLTMLMLDLARLPELSAEDAKYRWDLLKQALDTRQVAERAALGISSNLGRYPYGEVIQPWVRAKVTQADSLRRPGEDYLFGSQKPDWVEAEKWLQLAAKAYLTLQKDSTIYQDAIETHDRVLADFPYYAQWVANQRVASNAKEREKLVGSWRDQIVILSNNLRVLKSALAKTVPSPKDLSVMTAQVKSDFGILRAALGEECENLSAEETHDQNKWHNVNALLSIPLHIEQRDEAVAALRAKLLVSSRQTSKKFQGDGLDKVVTISNEGNLEKRTKENANWQKLLALTVLRLNWPEEMAPLEEEAPLKAGEGMAEVFKQWPEAINKGLREGLISTDLNKAERELRKADEFARGLPGGFHDRPTPYSVSEALRRLRLFNLLLVQTHRTTQDHWFSDSPIGGPYYMESALKYLKVAEAVLNEGVEGGEVKRERFKLGSQVREAVKIEGLELDGISQTYWTSEKFFPLTWTVKTPDDPYLRDKSLKEDAKVPPPGVAMTWRDLDGPAEWGKTYNPGQREAVELLTYQKKFDFPETFKLKKTVGDGSKIKATYNVFLRGQKLSTRTDIEPQPPEIIVHKFPNPPGSEVSVRMAPDFTFGAVCIALDISGSMIWDSYGIKGPDGKKRNRLSFALEALETTLHGIPKNTHLSVIAFYTRRDDKKETFVDVLKPERWNPDKLATVLDHIRDLEAKASQETDATASGGTPMAFGLVQCVQGRGFPPNFTGPKVLLALGDGQDTTSGGHLNQTWPDYDKMAKEYNKKVRNYLSSEIANSGVEIQFVCFLNPDANDETKKEAQNAREQFEIVKSFEPEGNFVIAPKPAELAKELLNAITPRLKLMQNNKSPSGYPEEGEQATLPNKSERNWKKVLKGAYTASVAKATQRTERSMVLDPGEMMALTLQRDKGNERKILVMRELFADACRKDIRALGDSVISQGRVVTILENDMGVKQPILKQLISVEGVSSAEGELRQSPPPFLWLETMTREDKRPTLLRWHREFGFPAPVYRLLSSNWPMAGTRAAPAKVMAWWTENPTDSQFGQTFEHSVKDAPARTIRLEGRSATVESVAIEEQDAVPDSQALVKMKTVPKQALVVRVNHMPGKPVMVLLTQKHKGEEHHFFSSANKCTAIFWELENPNLEKYEISLVFLDAIKEQVVPATFIVQGINTFPIQPNSLRE